MLNEDKLQPMVIDFASLRGGQLDENMIRNFANGVRMFLGVLLDQDPVSFFKGIVRGTPREIDSFVKTISSEKRYIEVAKKYGLSDPRTVSNSSKLRSAISSFERETGVKWPIK